jgi:hypothetical protein
MMQLASFFLGAAFGISMLSFIEILVLIRNTQQVTAQSVRHIVFDLLTASIVLALVIQLQ